VLIHAGKFTVWYSFAFFLLLLHICYQLFLNLALVIVQYEHFINIQQENMKKLNIILVSAIILLLAGCSSSPTLGDQMVEHGQNLVKEGNIELEKGTTLVEQGKAKIEQGNRLIEDGKKIETK
jgi:hypothetical protein